LLAEVNPSSGPFDQAPASARWVDPESVDVRPFLQAAKDELDREMTERHKRLQEARRP
jgi:hypothetical protein